MQYIVNISPEIVEIINRQIARGDYRTIQDFIITSVQNQVYLIEQSMTSNTPQIIPLKVVNNDENTDPVIDVKHDIVFQEYDHDKGYYTLSGFWNKFLPVKITLRALSNQIMSHGGPVILETLQETASFNARKIGLALKKTEKSSGRKRGDRLFTGLPVGRNSEKSRLRFKSHFVGNLNRTNIDGLPGTLRMLTMTKGTDGITYVGITKHGQDFTNLENPILDQNDNSRSLSVVEQSFLIKIIQKELPKETHRMQSILELIGQGNNDTKKLLELTTVYGEISTQKLSTELSGMLNRLTDLGLVIRRYDGLSYIYEISAENKNFMRKIS